MLRGKMEQSYNMPLLSTIPTIINVRSGAGVPGTFTGDNVKIPSQEIEKYTSEMNKTKEQLNTLENTPITSQNQEEIAKQKEKLNADLNSYNKKIAETKASAVDFSNSTSIPRMSSSNIPSPKIA